MAPQWPNDPDGVLRGLFGNLVAGAESGGRGAANMWSSLRTAATDWATGVLSVTSAEPPTPDAVAAKVHQLIGHVTIQDMNRYTAKVGEYLRAKSNLAQLGESNQITGAEIFTPPWATTANNPAIPTRYRIRVLRSITVRGFTHIQREEWATYEITSPLTSVGDALQQANTLFSMADYNARASINEILDYSIEVV